MNDKELFASYKKSAPLEDLRFFLRVVDCSAGLSGRLLALLIEAFDGEKLKVTRADFYRRFWALQDRWRQESIAAQAVDRAAAELLVEVDVLTLEEDLTLVVL